MKHLMYITAVLSIILLSACEEMESEETTPTTATSAPTLTNPGGSGTDINAAPALTGNPYYALRPTDDRWPPNIGGQVNLSKHLLSSNYYIVLDGSGSMASDECAEGSSKMEVAKAAISQFAQQIPTDANLGLFSFDNAGVSQRVELANNNREQFFNQVTAILPNGDTPLKTALSYGYQQLQNQAASQLGYGEYHLVVVTDGIATDNESPDQIVQTILQESPVVIHSIGFCIDEQHSLNQPGMTSYTAASNAEELQRGLQAVLAESSDFNSDSF